MASSSVFQKNRPNAAQLRQAGGWRLGDARALVASGDRARANGAIDMAGFAVECWLKARLLGKFPALNRVPLPDRLGDRERDAERLLWQHDVPALLDTVPDVQRSIEADLDPGRAAAMVAKLNRAAEWTIYIRYSARLEDIRVADDFVQGIEELKRWLI
jgi:hypothetical protein